MNIDKNVKSILAILFIGLSLYICIKRILVLFVPFLLAGLLAVLFNPIVTFLERKWKVRRILGTFGMLFILGVVLIGLGRGIFLFFSKQIEMLRLNMPFYQEKLNEIIYSSCEWIDEYGKFPQGSSVEYMTATTQTFKTEVMSKAIPKLTTTSVNVIGNIFHIGMVLIIAVIATIFILKDYEDIKNYLAKSRAGEQIINSLHHFMGALGAYIKAELLIVTIDYVICTTSLYIVGSPYFYLWGIAIAVVDLLPILGVGFILWPFAIYEFVTDGWYYGTILLVTYFLCAFLRQYIEPRMVGKEIGLHPLISIMAMYIGFRLFGFVGFILGPVSILVGKEIYKIVVE